MFHREPRLSPYGTDKNGSQYDEQALTNRKAEFLELLFMARDSDPLKNTMTKKSCPTSFTKSLKRMDLFRVRQFSFSS
jgi:hypothetical protein